MAAKKLGISANGCPSCFAWSTTIVGHTKQGEQKLHCVYCEHSFTSAPPPSLDYLSRTSKAKYPYHNWSLGQTVTSKDHENHVAGKLDMVPTSQRTFNKGTVPKRVKGKTIAVTKR